MKWSWPWSTRKRDPFIAFTGRHHDFKTARYWSHDCFFTALRYGGLEGTAMGFCRERVSPGDILELRGPNGGVSPYIVLSIDYFNDPKDMWKAELVYVGNNP